MEESQSKTPPAIGPSDATAIPLDTLAMDALPIPAPPIFPPLPASSVEPAAIPRRHFWPTMGFGCAIIGAWLATQLLVGFIYALCLAIGNRHAKFDQDAFTKSGLVLSLTTVVGAPVVIGLSLLFARLRAPMRAREYLGLHWPRLRTVIVGSITFVALIIAADVILGAFENSDETPVMVQFYRSAKIVPLFWLAIVVVGPASEEFFFRGFMLEGLRWSRLGAAGAVVSTATVWAAIHVQYDFAGMAYIFSVGLFLGWIRLRTKSLPLCIVLHGLMNLMATLQMEYRYGSD